MTVRRWLSILALALAALVALAGCPEKKSKRRTTPVRQGPTKKTPKKPPKPAPTSHHEHSHGHPHDDSDHHHHPHPHPHLPGQDGHHHPH